MTTAPAPTIDPSPIVTPGRRTEPPPMKQLRPIRIGRTSPPAHRVSTSVLNATSESGPTTIPPRCAQIIRLDNDMLAVASTMIPCRQRSQYRRTPVRIRRSRRSLFNDRMAMISDFAGRLGLLEKYDPAKAQFMNGISAMRKPTRSLLQSWQGWVKTRIWGMDIHPSAWIATTALIDRTWPRGVHIGANCVIDEEAVVLTHDLTRGLYCDTRIGAETIVGARAIILPGITIGCGCIIAAGALVNRDVPDGASVVGNPGRIVAAAPTAAR